MKRPAITAVTTPRQNFLLAAFSTDAQERVFPHLELVSLRRGESLGGLGHSPRHTYFPVDCAVSLLCVLESGAMAEIALVGNEGLIGLASVLGDNSTPSGAVVVSPGLSYRLLTQRLRDEFDRHDDTMRLLLRYTQSLMTQVTQTAACNRHHTIAKQLCRWFLLALDRVGGNRLEITQEMIAHMLGVRREGVCEAATKLQKAGAIAYRHGHITVLERSVLEQGSCECYTVVKSTTDCLLAAHHGLKPHEPALADLIAKFPQIAPITPPLPSEIVAGRSIRTKPAGIALAG